MKRQSFEKIILITLLLVLASSAPCAQNCADCGGDASVCYACEPSFELSVLSKCNPQTTNDRCILYGPGTTCFVCQPTFQLQSSKCVKDYSACLAVIDGNCFQCGFGTLLEGGKCVGTINCLNAQKTCSKCASGFTLKNGKCSPDEGCKSFDESLGVCKVCESGYDMIGYQCILSTKKTYDCYIYNSNMECLNCKYGFITYEKQCLLPDDIQALQTGTKQMSDILLQKKQKYDLKYATQQQSSTATTTAATAVTTPTQTPVQQPFKIDKCKVTDSVNKICALCEDRYYRSGSQCLMVKDVCKDYDMTSGKCTSCVEGCSLHDGDCVKIVQTQTQTQQQSSTQQAGGAVVITTQQGSTSITSQPITTSTNSSTQTTSGQNGSTSKDVNCIKFDSSKCVECSNRYFMSPVDGICVPVNPLCQTYNQKGACLSCYKGYKVSGQVCIASQQKDPYCKQVDSTNVCKVCFDGYFVNSTKACQTLNPLCKTSDLSNGKCTACYMGYTLSEGSCKIFVKDPNCQEYDSNSICIKCPSRFYISQGSCKQVSPLCKDHDKITGLCTECYPGYSNGKGACVIATSKTDDLSCKQKKNGVCVACYNGYYLNSKSLRCDLQNLICKTINFQNGNCATCYDGYVIEGSTCVLASQESTDVYCKTLDSKKKCTQCYSGYFIDTTGICQAYDPTCKQSDKKTGACVSCYNGYNLIGTKCVSDTPSLGLNADPYCIKVDGTKCLECNKGYFIANNGVCTQVDILCKTYSLENGFCTGCYTGYVLSNSKCILGQDLYIPFCKHVNSQGKCVECTDRYYLSNDVCTAVSLLCDAYNKLNGKCTSCTPGYFFQNDECIYPSLGVDPGCSFYTNSYCTKCKLGYYLDSFYCHQIDSKCLEFDYNKNVCAKCYNSTIQGPYCV